MISYFFSVSSSAVLTSTARLSFICWSLIELWLRECKNAKAGGGWADPFWIGGNSLEGCDLRCCIAPNWRCLTNSFVSSASKKPSLHVDKELVSKMIWLVQNHTSRILLLNWLTHWYRISWRFLLVHQGFPEVSCIILQARCMAEKALPPPLQTAPHKSRWEKVEVCFQADTCDNVETSAPNNNLIT